MFLNKVVLVDHIVCGIGSKVCRSDYVWLYCIVDLVDVWLYCIISTRDEFEIFDFYCIGSGYTCKHLVSEFLCLTHMGF